MSCARRLSAHGVCVGLLTDRQVFFTRRALLWNARTRTDEQRADSDETHASRMKSNRGWYRRWRGVVEKSGQDWNPVMLVAGHRNGLGSSANDKERGWMDEGMDRPRVRACVRAADARWLRRHRGKTQCLRGDGYDACM